MTILLFVYYMVAYSQRTRDELHPRLGENDDSPFRDILGFGFDLLRFVFLCCLFRSSFCPTKGASEAQSSRRRDVSSIEMMAAALRRTTAHVISRPMACREATRHLVSKQKKFCVSQNLLILHIKNISVILQNKFCCV